MSEWVPRPHLKALRPLMPGDAEYRMMDYSLKLALRSVTVKILSVHALHHPDENIKFERDNIGSTILDSWVYTPALPEDNTIEQISSHGGRFRITDPTRGALFTSGGIRLHLNEHGDEYNQRGRPGGAMQLELLHLRLSAGQSFVMEKNHIGKYPVPEGYHSIKIHNESKTDPNDYFNEYIINDETKVWPDFVVNCVYDPEEDRRGLGAVSNKVASWRTHCYQDAFAHTFAALENQKRQLADRRQTILNQLSAIDERMNQVTQNHAHAQDKIYKAVQQVVQVLHNRTQAKLNLLQSDDSELRRQLEYFDWVESFLNYQQTMFEKTFLDPVEFLQNAQQHKLVVEDAPCEIVDSYNTVTADMKVVGNLTILVDGDKHQQVVPNITNPQTTTFHGHRSQPSAIR